VEWETNSLVSFHHVSFFQQHHHHFSHFYSSFLPWFRAREGETEGFTDTEASDKEGTSEGDLDGTMLMVGV
jgi:hypothetical protein